MERWIGIEGGYVPLINMLSKGGNEGPMDAKRPWDMVVVVVKVVGGVRRRRSCALASIDDCVSRPWVPNHEKKPNMDPRIFI